MFSIRRFLSITLMLVVSGTGLTLTGVTFLHAYHEVDELFDAELARNARLAALMLSAGGEMDPAVLARPRNAHEYELYLALQHWSSDGVLLLSGGGVPSRQLAPMSPGFYQQEFDGQQWRVFTLAMPEGGWLMVGEQSHIRDELVRNAALTVTLPYLLAIPLILILVSVALRRGLRPLSRLAAAIQRRDDRNLAPLDYGADVEELRPVVTALNRLLVGLDQALVREQRFTADAAHELRTLLMVLKLHSDNARTLTDPEDARISLDKLRAGVDRASRMVTQLLALARLDPDDGGALREPGFLAPVARQVVAGLDPLACERGQTVTLDVEPESLKVALREEALDILLRNLVENALRYSPEGTPVSVEARRREGLVLISISDKGEGVPEELGYRVRERFFRASRAGDGVGLGLAIVQRILEHCDGKMRFVPRSSGEDARVEVTIPTV